jgi:hypothetical protein
MEATEFAELLRDVLLSDIANGEVNPFNCIFIAVQSARQQSTFNKCFQEWLAKNVVPDKEENASPSTSSAELRSGREMMGLAEGQLPRKKQK